jgi:hypothetical protein
VATEDLTTQAGWEAFQTRHGGPVGQPSKTSPDFDPNGARVKDPFYTYTMQDGTTVEINGAGEIKSMDEKAPSVATGTAAPAQSSPPLDRVPYTVYNPDGSTTTYQYGRGKDGQYHLLTDLPPETKPAAPGSAPPSDPSTWVQIHADPSDPKSKVIAIQDPKNASNRVAVPEGAQPTRPTVVNGQNGAMYSWDGTTLKPLIASTPDKPQLVQGQQGALYTWDGKTLTTLQAGTQPKEGDTRPNVQSGYSIQEIYRGGQWVTDPSVEPKPYSPDLLNKPKEGDVRPNVQSGYKVQEIYKGGQWVVDPSVSPTRYTPTTPTQVSAGTDQPYINTMTDGQLSSVPNPSFMPKTPADVAMRVSQLQQAAQTKRDELSQKMSSGALSQADAAAQFDRWWNQTVEPQKNALDVAQRQATVEQQQKTSEQDRLNYATASQAGTNAVEAAKAQMPYMVGPGFAGALNNIQQAYATGKAPGNVDIGSAVTFQMPDLNALAQQATNQALAHLSPTAAQNMNATHGVQAAPALAQSSQTDVSQQLNRTNYTPTTTVAPDGTVTVSHQGQPQPSQPSPQIPQHPFYAGLQQGYGAAPQQDFRGLAQGQQQTGLLPFNPMSDAMQPYQYPS